MENSTFDVANPFYFFFEVGRLVFWFGVIPVVILAAGFLIWEAVHNKTFSMKRFLLFLPVPFLLFACAAFPPVTYTDKSGRQYHYGPDGVRVTEPPLPQK